MTRASFRSTPQHRSLHSGLPRPVQEHLARQLRAVYGAEQGPPAFLGDPGLPVGFEEPLGKLIESERFRARQRASACGLEAVRRALESSGGLEA